MCVEELGGGTATSREALEDKTRRRRRGGGGGRERGCVPPKPVSSRLLSRGRSREPCPKSLAPGGRLSIVKRWPLQAGPPAATAAASCPPPPPAHTHTHTHTHTPPPSIPSTFSTMTMLPAARATGQWRALKRTWRRLLRKATAEQHVFWLNINDDKLGAGLQCTTR